MDAFASCLFTCLLFELLFLCVLFSSSSFSFVCLNRVCCAPPFSNSPFALFHYTSFVQSSVGCELHSVENGMLGKMFVEKCMLGNFFVSLCFS